MRTTVPAQCARPTGRAKNAVRLRRLLLSRRVLRPITAMHGFWQRALRWLVSHAMAVTGVRLNGELQAQIDELNREQGEG